ncbi:MAG: hypothetical protein G8D26_00180 [Buchnera aphidicola (Periphyllus acericola)]|uniref:hypothetical protein n=1 Tax=Buchnera aphidicola TaxID=9 RepID=UPI0030CE29E2|nr:hypothetical protein [Buchnera aphidicola (Periphyllus acericola)]
MEKKIIKHLAKKSILKYCHIGLKPKNINKEKEYKIQRKSKIDSKKFIKNH